MSGLNPSKKRHRSGNTTVWTVHLINEKRAQNIPISGRIILQKAEDFATRSGDYNFKANTGLTNSSHDTG